MLEPKDKNGVKVTIGTKVSMPVAPVELLSGLPESDQSAIQAVVGRKLTVKGFNKYGHAELRFIDKNGIIHYIWVHPTALQVIRKKSGRHKS